MIAGTGYQYGDTNYVAYSDQVYVDIAQQLDYGPGRVGGPAPVPVDVGTAVLAAKQQYLASLDQLNGMEEKALQEITLYGLPMVGVAQPNQVSTPGGPSSAVSAAPVPATTPPSAGDQLGLEEADLNVSPTLSALKTVEPVGTTTSYSYYSGPQGVVADPGGPVLPVQTEDVNVTGQTLRGVGLWGGTYTSTAGTNPLTGDPATETGNSNLTPFASPVLFPQTIWNPNYFSTLLSGGVNTELALTPVQYESDPGSTTTDTRLTYSGLDLHLFYSDNTGSYNGNVPALAAPPTISDVTSTTDDALVNVSATVAGEPSAGIQEVWVTYTTNSAGSQGWASTDLTQSPTDSTLWTGSFPAPAGGDPTQGLFMVQAVNGVGEVSMNNNDGYYFTPSLTPGAPPAVGSNTYTLSVGGATGGQYLGSATVTAALAATGGQSPIVGDQPVTFSLGPTTVAAVTNGAGTATAVVPLIEPPGSYTLSASYAGDANDQPATGLGTINIAPAPTALVLTAPATGQLTSGVNSGVTATLTTNGAPLAQKPVYFEVSTPSKGGTPGTVVGTGIGITNGSGVAQAGSIAVIPGDVGAGYSVTAYFAANNVAVPGGTPGQTYNASDPEYSASTSNSATVTVADPSQTISGAHTGALSIGSGQVVVVTGKVTGAVSVGSGGALEVEGGSITGALSASGAAVLTLCGGTVGGALSASGSVGNVFIGGGTLTGCGPSSISGAVSLSGNKAGLEVANSSIGGAASVSGNSGSGTNLVGDTIGGSLSVSGNSGSGTDLIGNKVGGAASVTGNTGSGTEVAGNTIGGALACSGNVPPPTDAGQLNKAAVKSGQCAGASF